MRKQGKKFDKKSIGCHPVVCLSHYLCTVEKLGRKLQTGIKCIFCNVVGKSEAFQNYQPPREQENTSMARSNISRISTGSPIMEGAIGGAWGTPLFSSFPEDMLHGDDVPPISPCMLDSTPFFNSVANQVVSDVLPNSTIQQGKATFMPPETQKKAPRKKPSTASKKSTQEEDKKHQRMLKNREIARNCRKRKRERMQMYEKEVVRLREVNRQLELKMNKGQEGKDREDLRKVKIEKLRSLVAQMDDGQSNNPSSLNLPKATSISPKDDNSEVLRNTNSQLKNIMHEYAEMYSDFGDERRIAIKFHLDSLRSLLIPTQVSKMLFWTLGQENEAFYDEKQPESQEDFGGCLWNLIGQACHFSPEQKRKILKSRTTWKNEHSKVASCVNILSELEVRVDNNFKSLRSQMNSLMKITDPSQQARFLLWIEENQACMHMLNNLWHTSNPQSTNVSPGISQQNEPSLDSSSSSRSSVSSV